jgi:Heavy metal binding domain
MKKTFIAFMLLAVIVFAACNYNGTTDNKKDTFLATSTADTSKATRYTCKMHPEVIGDTPGHCSKCGMTMVPVKDGTKQ